MKLQLFKLLFRKEFEACNQVINNCEKKIRLANRTIEQNEIKYGIAKRIFFLFPSAKIVAVETNENEEELFVVEKITEHAITIYLFGEFYQGITGLPRIESTILYDYENEKKYIHIEDVQNQENSKGNGSILMKYFIQAARKEKLEYIDGWLSDADSDHFDRLDRYYKKFGFAVSFNADRTSRNIELIL